jgi:hypothetical protein
MRDAELVHLHVGNPCPEQRLDGTSPISPVCPPCGHPGGGGGSGGSKMYYNINWKFHNMIIIHFTATAATTSVLARLFSDAAPFSIYSVTKSRMPLAALVQPRETPMRPLASAPRTRSLPACRSSSGSAITSPPTPLPLKVARRRLGLVAFVAFRPVRAHAVDQKVSASRTGQPPGPNPPAPRAGCLLEQSLSGWIRCHRARALPLSSGLSKLVRWPRCR